MQELFANNAESTIDNAGGITSTGTSITLPAGEGARFPAAVTGTSQFRAVLVDATTNAVLEYITVTNRSTDTLTVTRESEDATRFPKAARAQGVKVVDVITAAVLNLIGVPPGGGPNQVLTKLTSADYAQAWTTPGFGGGDYFKSGDYSLGMSTGAATTTLALTLNTLYLRPFIVPVRRAFDRIGITVTTVATAASGGVLRFGLYTTVDGRPSARIVDAGTVSSEGSAGARAVVLSNTLDPGLYWLATVAQVATCTVTALNNAGANPWTHSNNSGSPFTNVTGVQGYFENAGAVSGALPATITTPAASQALASCLRAA